MIIIDTRSKSEYESGHVDSALNIPPEVFMENELPEVLRDVVYDEKIIVYCRTGSRSNVVAHILSQHGFTNVTNGINQGRVEKMISNN